MNVENIVSREKAKHRGRPYIVQLAIIIEEWATDRGVG